MTEGQFVELACSGSGHPLPQTTWAKMKGEHFITQNVDNEHVFIYSFL